MPVELGRRLLNAGIVPSDELEAALFLSVVRGIPFTRALVDRGATRERTLEDELARSEGEGHRAVRAGQELASRLPRAMCRRLAAVPVDWDPDQRRVLVVAVDPMDPHIAAEFSFHLGVRVHVERGTMAAVEEAIRALELDEEVGRRRKRRVTPAFPHGAPDSSLPPPPPMAPSHEPSAMTRDLSVASEPPLSEDMPIPLVRRVGVPLIDPDEEGMGALAYVRPDEETITREMDQTGSAPRVSFPSSPPPPGSAAIAPAPRERRHTPPQGTALAISPVTGKTLRPPSLATATLAPVPGLPAQSLPALDEAEESLDDRPPTLPFADPDRVLKALREAGNRDEIVRCAVLGLRMVARRVAVFAVRRDGFVGWLCSPEFGDPDALRSLVVPHDSQSVLSSAMASSVYLGPVAKTPTHAGLLALTGGLSRDVAVVTARASGRPALMLVADELGDTLISTRRMSDIAGASGEALTRLLAQRL